MRTIKFRARFRNIRTRKECWQYVEVNYKLDPHGFIQMTEWEQFTGLTDKNGVDIYEGDIVNVPYNRIGNVDVKYIDKNCSYNVGKYNTERIYVIGNIHQL